MAYGIWYVWCKHEGCGWMKLSRKEPADKMTVCEACRRPVTWVFDSEVACRIVHFSEVQSEHLHRHVRSHGYMLLQLSARRWQLCRFNTANRINYRDDQARSFGSLERVGEPGDWQRVMKLLKEKTPDLPGYLKGEK